MYRTVTPWATAAREPRRDTGLYQSAHILQVFMPTHTHTPTAPHSGPRRSKDPKETPAIPVRLHAHVSMIHYYNHRHRLLFPMDCITLSQKTRITLLAV